LLRLSLDNTGLGSLLLLLLLIIIAIERYDGVLIETDGAGAPASLDHR
jgi:hypothetical protein